MATDHAPTRTATRVSAAVLAGLVSSACYPSISPFPSAVDSSDATIVVIVRSRDDHRPIHGALVRYRSSGWYTDESGQSTVPVVAGEDAAIAVSAPGYGEMSASGVVSDGERWTFYLEAIDPALRDRLFPESPRVEIDVERR